jgi:hypothetical protein
VLLGPGAGVDDYDVTNAVVLKERPSKQWGGLSVCGERYRSSEWIASQSEI